MIPKTFDDADMFLGARDRKNLTGKEATYLIRNENGSISMVYQNTKVVTWNRNHTVIVQTDGYRTVTTKRRLNQGTRHYVFQHKHNWFITVDGKIHPFTDGMILPS